MADNVAITAGAGTTVGTDDVGGVHYQRVKIDIGGDGASTPVVATTIWATRDTWRATLAADENTNDSDKSFTVTASQEWQLVSIWVELATTATVGNRQMTIEIQDGSADVLGVIKSGITQSASLTYNYLFAVGVSDLTAVRSSTYLMTPLVPWILPAGYIIRVYDSAAVDAAADDMVVQMIYNYRAV